MAKCDISILICTRNRRQKLAQLLENLCEVISKIPPEPIVEVVVVDNQSSDKTNEILCSFASKLSLKTICLPARGISDARNAAVKLSSGSLLLFTDDDVIVSAAWIESYWKAFCTHGEKFYYGGPVDIFYENHEPEPWLLAHPLTPLSIRGLTYGNISRQLGDSDCFIGPNWCCSKALFLQAGTFDMKFGTCLRDPSGLSGEETDFMRRLRALGTHPWYVSEARVTHRVSAEKTSLDAIIRRIRSYAKAEATITLSLREYVHILECWLLSSLRYGAKRLLSRNATSELLWSVYFRERVCSSTEAKN